MHNERRFLFPAILLCFLLSGAAGLIYQVAWSKSLGLIFGNTVYATATVLAVFMGGLAAGSAVLGRWGETQQDAVALYGWAELMLAISGALSLLGLAGVRAFYVSVHPTLAGSTATLLGLRLVGAAVVLLLPTFLMGGTLPILVKGALRTSADLGARLSRLYWVNTLGAAAGTFASGFWLIPTWGLRRTVAVAVGLNILAGVLALALSKYAAPATEAGAARGEGDSPAAAANEASLAERWLLGTFALVGATAIVYEICWTRLLATTIGSSTYAFTLMLGTFLSGIVLGSALFEICVRRGVRITLRTYAATQLATALAALAFVVFFQRMPELVPRFLQGAEGAFSRLVLLQLTVSALAMLPAAVVFGFNFPAVTLLIAGRPGRSGHAAAVGRAYAANTCGAIAGALLAGFLLVPALGAFRMVGFAAAANAALALVLYARHAGRFRPWLALQGALLAFVGWVALSGAFYNRDLATFNAVLYWNIYSDRLTLGEMAQTNDILFAEDGMNANISVVRSEGYLSLRTNGKVDASNLDVLTQLVLGHIGGGLHPAPKRVLVIGFGSGMTVAALAAYPDVQKITCVEIEPAVLRAAPLLESLNRGVLRDPRVHVVLEDARTFLLTTREQFDVIISEPSNPWIAGVATLFTDEYYREARARLAPGGMFVQWVQAYSLFPDDFRMVLATLAPHFAKASLWRGESSDYVLVGLTEDRPLRLDRLHLAWELAAVRADLEQLGLRRPEGLLAFHRLDNTDLRRLLAGAPRNTDDHTRLEYNAPRALLATGIEDKNRSQVWQARSGMVPQDVKLENEYAALQAAAETLLELEELDDAEKFVDELVDAPETAPLLLLRGRLALARSLYTRAHDAFERALQLDPALLPALLGMGTVARKRFQLDSAELIFRQVLARQPRSADALEGLFHVARSRQRWTDAAEWRIRLIDVKGKAAAEDFKQLGEVNFQAGNLTAAEGNFRKLLALEAHSYSAHRNLGEIQTLRKDWEAARPLLEFVVRFNPDTEAKVYSLLATTYQQLGRAGDAAAIRAKGRRIFPGDSGLK